MQPAASGAVPGSQWRGGALSLPLQVLAWEQQQQQSGFCRLQTPPHKYTEKAKQTVILHGWTYFCQVTKNNLAKCSRVKFRRFTDHIDNLKKKKAFATNERPSVSVSGCVWLSSAAWVSVLNVRTLGNLTLHTVSCQLLLKGFYQLHSSRRALSNVLLRARDHNSSCGYKGRGALRVKGRSSKVTSYLPRLVSHRWLVHHVAVPLG